MSKREDKHRSILVVSSSEQFNTSIKKSLDGFVTIDIRKSVAMARRCTIERHYNLIVINAPLPDETGEEFAIDVAESGNSSVLIVVSQDGYDDVLERVTDFGILAISKPLHPGILDKAVRFLVAMQNRMHQLEKKSMTIEEKMEEIRIVSKAKLVLVEKRHVSEDEAHRFIGRQAMNNGVSRRRVAEKILQELGS